MSQFIVCTVLPRLVGVAEVGGALQHPEVWPRGVGKLDEHVGHVEDLWGERVRPQGPPGTWRGAPPHGVRRLFPQRWALLWVQRHPGERANLLQEQARWPAGGCEAHPDTAVTEGPPPGPGCLPTPAPGAPQPH